MPKFRESALAKLQSPEQVDQPLCLRPRQTRLACITLLAVAGLALLWAVFGRIPVTGRGQAILLTPNTVTLIQAPAAGQIGRWFVTVGSFVKAGEIIGTLHQPALERELAQAQVRLVEAELRHRALKELRQRSAGVTTQMLDTRRRTFKARIVYREEYITKLKRFSEEVQAKNEKLLHVERENLQVSRRAVGEISKQAKERRDTFQRLLKEKLASDDAARAAREKYDDVVLKLSDLNLQLKDLDSKVVQARQTSLDTRDLISLEENTLTQLLIQLREVDTREAQARKQLSEEEFREKAEVSDLKQSLERLEQRLATSQAIRSEHAGRILELTAAEAGVVVAGQRLAQIDTRLEGQELIALAYFRDQVGKQLTAGMPVRVAPTTVSQKRHGSIKGAIKGVSPYPITADAVANYVGNTEVARRLTEGGYQIEVQVLLENDTETPSGYAWTSRPGPDVTITAGTGADVWVTYERRAPISYVMPVVRQWLGL